MPDLDLYRRHTAKCACRKKHHKVYTKCALATCSCPIWADGILEGKRVRQSLGTCDSKRAGRLRDALEDLRDRRLANP